MMYEPKNVLGETLEVCCTEPMTGFYRDGCCRTGADDVGIHVVCAQMTEEFLEFSRQRGNDLSTPRPEFLFPGLKPGDYWCLCADRWQEALKAGVAPPIKLASTHISALEFITMADLERYAIDDHEEDLSIWEF
ncbi:MAG: DUF2237 domain-containing protein [Caldilineaceae bacterium]|nr:DUF2237 domain-containing protein [Caldilineaceae bacterium]